MPSRCAYLLRKRGGGLRENAEGKEVAPTDTHLPLEAQPGGAGARSKRTVLGFLACRPCGKVVVGRRARFLNTV